MINIKNKYKIIISCILICLFGLLMVYSSSTIWAEYKFNDSFKFVKAQSIFFVIGISLIIFFNKLDINYLKKKSNLIKINLVVLSKLLKFFLF